jgi:hypothetical protein
MGVGITLPPDPSRVATRSCRDPFPAETRLHYCPGPSRVATRSCRDPFPAETLTSQDPFPVGTRCCRGQFPAAIRSGLKNFFFSIASLDETGSRIVWSPVGAVE